MDCEEKKIDGTLLYDGRILQLYRDRVLLPDGSQADREYVHHTGGSSVLAVDGEKNLYLVEQYRYPYHEMILEIPAGKLNAGESAYECALRELKEETGLTAARLRDLGVIYPTPAYTDEPLHIFLAEDFTEGESRLDEHEFLNLKKIALSQALKMIDANQIRDSKTVAAITRYALGLTGKNAR